MTPLFKKKTKKTISTFERDSVNKLIKILKEEFGSRIYIQKDQDSGAQRFKSGWDFFTILEGDVIFFEAKVEGAELTLYQKLTKQLILEAAGKYRVIEFSKDGMIIFREKLSEHRYRIEDIKHYTRFFC